MKKYDNLMIPVITSTAEGEIVYKNKAAKRCIPSPRTKANILHRINRKNLRFRKDFGDTRVEYIKNDKSIFNRALVICDTETAQELWFFSPELQLYEPEDITDQHIKAMAGWLRNNTKLIVNLDPLPDKMFDRYQKIGEELLSAMKYMDIEASSRFFKVTDILSSLKHRTKELASRLNIRMGFSVDVFDPYGGYELRFRPFASVYAQLLNLIVRISKKPEIGVKIVKIKDALELTLTSMVKTPDLLPSQASDTSALIRVFPHEAVNLLFLEQYMRLMQYELYYTVGANGLLELRVYVPLNDKRDYTISMPIPELVAQTMFKRAEKRVSEFLESVFTL